MNDRQRHLTDTAARHRRHVWTIGAALSALVVVGVAVAVALLSADGNGPQDALGEPTVPSETGPTINDHWHAAYGFFLCDEWVILDGDLMQTDPDGAILNEQFLYSGVHSHDDGVIHWHPFTSRSTGSNAVLGLFLDGYGVELTDDVLRFPETQADGAVYDEAETLCHGSTAELRLITWSSVDRPDDFTDVDSGFADAAITGDGMAFAIVFAPADAATGLPPSSADLQELGDVDRSVSPDLGQPVELPEGSP